MYQAQLMYESPMGFYAGPNCTWIVTQYPVDNANLLYTPASFLLGFRAGCKVAKGLEVFIDARNRLHIATRRRSIQSPAKERFPNPSKCSIRATLVRSTSAWTGILKQAAQPPMTKTCWAVMLRLKPGMNAFARTMAGPCQFDRLIISCVGGGEAAIEKYNECSHPGLDSRRVTSIGLS